MRPKHAASLIIIDGEGENLKIYMGKRHQSHAFMPDFFVFPGGRLDRADFNVPYMGELEQTSYARLRQNIPVSAISKNRPQALAIAALRECYEETGMVFGTTPTKEDKEKAQKFARLTSASWAGYQQQNLLPDISAMLFFARAITPPDRNRRFDARFFIIHKKQMSVQLTPPTDELLDQQWVSIHNDLQDIPMATITRCLIEKLKIQSLGNSLFDPQTPAQFFRKIVNQEHVFEEIH